MIRRLVLISVLVFVIFFTLSENEAWLHKKATPLRETVSARIAGIHTAVSTFLAARSRDFNEKFNSEIDRLEAKIDELKLGQQSAESPEEGKGATAAANPSGNKL